VPGFWHGAIKLIRLKARLEVRDFTHSSITNKIVNAVAYLMILGFVGAETLLALAIFFVARAPSSLIQAEEVELQLAAIPGLALTMSLTIGLSGSFALALQELFLAKDLPFLLVRPVPLRSLIISRLITASMPVLASSSMVILPWTAALGFTAGYSGLYYLFYAFTVTVLILCTGAISALAAILVSRWLNPRLLLVAIFMLFMGAFLALLFFIEPTKSSEYADILNPSTIFALLDSIPPAERLNSPFTWAGDGLVAIGRGNTWQGILQLLPLLATCAALYGAALLLAERLYLSSFNRHSAGPKLKWTNLRSRRWFKAITALWTTAARLISPIFGPISPDLRAMVLKDFRFFSRDLTYLSVTLAPLLMNLVLILTIIKARADTAFSPTAGPDARNISQWLLLFIKFLMPFFLSWIAQFMSLFLGANLLVPLISLEGRGITLLRSLPFTPRRFLNAKLLTGIILFIPGYAFFTATLQIFIPSKSFLLIMPLYVHLAQAATLTALIAFYLNLGAGQARFDWIHPGRLMNAGVFVNLAAGVVFFGGAFLFFEIIPALVYAVTPLPLLSIPVGLIGGGGYCALVFRGQYRQALRKMEKIFAGD
jgi:hypothetical protein